MKVYDLVSKVSAFSNAKVFVDIKRADTGLREEIYVDRWTMLHPEKLKYPFYATVTQFAIANNNMVIYAFLSERDAHVHDALETSYD